MNAVIIIGLYAAVPLITFQRPRAAFACAAASCFLGAWTEWSRNSIAAATLSLLYAATFVWLTLVTRAVLATEPEAER